MNPPGKIELPLENRDALDMLRINVCDKNQCFLRVQTLERVMGWVINEGVAAGPGQCPGLSRVEWWEVGRRRVGGERGVGPHVALESTCRPDCIDHKGWRVLSWVFHSDKFLMEIIPCEYACFMFIKQ